MLVILSIILCSIALSIFEATKALFTRQLQYIHNVFVYRNQCTEEDKRKILYVYYLIVYSIGLWMPLLLVIIVHVAMYLKLKTLALVRAASTSSDTQGQLNRISRVFLMTVVAFYICTLPLSVLTIFVYLGDKLPSNGYIIMAQNFAIPLQISNCCLNPFIYSKIHQKVYRGMKNVIVAWITGRENSRKNEVRNRSRGNKASSGEMGESQAQDEVRDPANRRGEATQREENENHTDHKDVEVINNSLSRDHCNINEMCDNNGPGCIEKEGIVSENSVSVVDSGAYKKNVQPSDIIAFFKSDSSGKENDGFSEDENTF